MKTKHYVLSLAITLSLVACSKEKTKTVTVENPNTIAELNKSKQEKADLEKKLALAGNNDKLAADLKDSQDKLAAANKKITDLGTSIDGKDKEITDLNKQIDDAKKSNSDQVKDLQDKLAKAEADKTDLQNQLKTANAEKEKLSLVVEQAKQEKADVEKLLDYALSASPRGYTIQALASVGDVIAADLISAAQNLDWQAAQASSLESEIANQVDVFQAAKTKLEDFNKNLQSIRDELSARDAETLSDADKATLATLNDYFTVVKAIEDQTAQKAKLEADVRASTTELNKQNGIIRQAHTERLTLVDQLVAELQKVAPNETLVADLNGKIKAQEAIRSAADSAAADAGTKLDAQKAELAAVNSGIEAIATSTSVRFGAFAFLNARDAWNAAAELDAVNQRLEVLNINYADLLKEIADFEAKRDDLKDLSRIFNKLTAN